MKLGPILPMSYKKLKANVEHLFSLHIDILQYLDEAEAPQKVKIPCDTPPKFWVPKTVAKIYGKWKAEVQKPSNRTLTALECEFKNAIIQRRTFNPPQRLYDLLTPASMESLYEKVDSTIDKIERGVFAPSRIVQPSGLYRKFSLLPQPSFTKVSIQVDTAALYDILRLGGHQLPTGGKNAFLEQRDEHWDRFFDLSLLKGVGGTNKHFDHFLTTDGIKAGLVCTRPKPNTWKEHDLMGKDAEGEPEISKDSTIWGCDPGIRSIVTMTNTTVDHESNDPPQVIELTGKQYHHQCFHNQARINRQKRLLMDPTTVDRERRVVLRKTADQREYEAHLRSCLDNGTFKHLVEFNGNNREDTWRSFRYRQRTLDDFANFVWRCSDSAAKKKDIILAYGDASFNHAMRGHRAIPTHRFPKTMGRHMTLSYTSEYRTSQQCSQLCTDDFQRLKNVKHEDSNNTIFAVKYCEDCKIFWNRDENAARNILHKCLKDKIEGYVDPHFQRPTSSSRN